MSFDMNKTIEEASLDNLHDIILPDSIGIFPLAPGWIIFLALFLALCFHVTIKILHQYKNSKYKSEAKKKIKIYRQESKENSILLLSLAKRVGIAAYGRKTIANLWGHNWWDFMQLHSRVQVSAELRKEIDSLLYDETYKMNATTHNKLVKLVKLWINSHRVNKYD